MNTIVKFFTFSMLVSLAIVGCKKNENLKDGDFDRSGNAFPDPRTAPVDSVILPNVISSNMFLDSLHTWIVNGPTFVTNGARLRIQAGTFIKGRKVSTSTNPSFILVTKGAKISANGTLFSPVVFTSNQKPCNRTPGDWGGLVILGNGLTNVATTTVIEGIAASYIPSSPFLSYPASIQYGGTSESDAANIDTLANVRIEFAGDILEANNELNGLTLGAVGSASRLENIQVSWGADDGYEFFGGSVNARNLVSYGNNDDDFDFDQGYQGTIQFAVGLKVPCINPPYSSNPNGIECNNVTSPVTTVNTRKTHPVLANFTLLGTSTVPAPTAGTGVVFRAAADYTMVNSVIGGFSTAVNTWSAGTAFTTGGNSIHGFSAFPIRLGITGSFIAKDSSNNASTNTALRLASPFSISCACGTSAIPDFRYIAGSVAASGAVAKPSVSHPGGVFPAAGSLTTTTYVGAEPIVSGSRWDIWRWVSYFPQGNGY
jgi:hypothetical protein